MQVDCPFPSTSDIRTIEDLAQYVNWRVTYVSAEFRKEKAEYDANPSKHKKADGYFLRAGMHSEIVTIRALLEQIMKEDAE